MLFLYSDIFLKIVLILAYFYFLKCTLVGSIQSSQEVILSPNRERQIANKVNYGLP